MQVLLGIVIAIAILVIVNVLSGYIYVGRPNEVLIISGREHVLPSGAKVGYRVLTGGWAFKWPLFESVQRMDLRNMEVEVKIRSAYSHGGIPLNVHAVANVKISEDPKFIGNAIERFLGKHRAEVANVAKQMLEGQLRGVISRLTPEQLNEDRIEFAKHLRDEAEDDLLKLGLHLDTFNIHHVTDDANYLNSVGRQRIAQILRDAEVAESNAQREATQVESEALGAAAVAKQKADMAIATKANEVRKVKGELEGQARSFEERAKAAADTARAIAEQELQKVRAALEEKRLAADVVAPSKAENDARAILARGDAAPIAERGKAVAASLELLNQAWKDAGDGAKTIVLIQQLETVLKQVVARLEEVKVGSVTLVDDGDGTALPRHIASYPAAVTAVLAELSRTVGIDVSAALAVQNGAQAHEGVTS